MAHRGSAGIPRRHGARRGRGARTGVARAGGARRSSARGSQAAAAAASRPRKRYQPSGQPERPQSIGGYVMHKTIGEGTFGKVRLGAHQLTGEKVAVKVLESSRVVTAADKERVRREVQILKSCAAGSLAAESPRGCRNVVPLYEVIDDVPWHW